MIVETGHFALILALCVALVQAVIPLVGAQKGWSGWMAVATPAALAQFGLIAIAFAALTYAFVTSDFSLKLVYENSHTDKPMLYKVTGVWGNHEGSMLLWVLILAMFGAAAAAFGGALPERLRARVLAVQGTIGVAFLVFVLFTSNPFLRLEEAPFNGRDMNPLLQDPGLAFHPPFLYLGYVGLSMAFSFAVAALIEGRVDAAWARWVRPWTLAAWIFLTIGIALGSWWAYYELGWGGFWFWDPVENASLMPWLLAAALLHSAIVVEKREALKSWTILLAIMAFGFSLIGTFLVRSGVISSVHSFANDPERGVFILFILAFFTGGALTLYAARASEMQAKGLFSMVSRESALVMNNVLLAVAALVVFTGTVWPLIAELFWDRKLSVGAPFFEKAFTPFMVGLALLLPLGSMMPWKRASLGKLVRPLLPALVLTLAVLALVWVMATGRPMLALGAAGLGAWILFGALAEIWQRAGRTPGRILRLPRADWGKAFAHGGLGIVFAGVGLLMAGQVEDIRVAKAGDSFEVAGYTITLVSVEDVPGPNFTAKTATMEVRQGGKLVATLHPEKRIYPVQAMPTTEADIDNGFWRDVYLVIGDPQEGGGWAVRTYVKPFANWIWAGCLLMAFGGGLSLTDRRYRSAAGARRATVADAVAAE
ncbi:heme lyase CcmF/NrfE family subunit [Rhodobacter capsulatus]|jgi:cytochrome c-type biogenesis protein CcmF|uniref:Cytochrome c-type biogenesis protein ccl1 n=1 Tax=Rhodobacter capsulatus (strain ATCC BAA-309 / NBRC 16581 / SB1003) TaxID=272942 RepID=CCMF_RHOCB|nr:heme lyase CcmF/NrfE family subunit [Rhodobacter capsulatus]Q00500.1 RecName: Full=Cytochrome c-type biogenesis protein ccl1 [Rhodobacter capsulatus SB 1003]ADE86860.1 cytochrome c-type biogenesis protein CcmF [Rhodobacter capsulatus SB 1003]ETD00398.1 heme lyase subunit CcmF [Rhodobacter capsulatus DE442]ETD74738.1 heme lyase subunit CcmF [Rhodobacter capsulatus R121]ETE52304.1 heme lyase subunit CcmF [Rhodobacter capsulatus Y262]MDS0928660.1 heme lyase CcmF/NrfE family subunit [Rhodobact